MDWEDNNVKRRGTDMEDWKSILAEVDDDYLIGLSNKGIVKRAYKDKEEVAAEVGEIGAEASVKVGEETVTVCLPLGESKCTCPSRSICRHVVQAILVLKESTLASASADAMAAGSAGNEEAVGRKDSTGNRESTGSEEGRNVEGETKEEGKTEEGKAEEGKEESGKGTGENSPRVEKDLEPGTEENLPENGTKEREGQKAAEGKGQEAAEKNGQGAAEVKGQETAGNKAPDSSKVMQEIKKYSFAALKKVLGVRGYQTLLGQAMSDQKPEIKYASVITVRLTNPEAVVKLLSPIEYSSCTCHKKELCIHKATAILWCQLEAGMMTKEELAEEGEDAQVFDMDEVKEAAGQMKGFLEELFATGLSRTSPDVLNYLERLAIISHNAGLAKFEGYFRALLDSYDRYLKRKASFQTGELMTQITRLYRRVGLLSKAKDSSETAKYAGEFKADYTPVGNLDLIGVAMESFQSQTGYEGETIYFLEENTKQWYTYTNARPVFYENGRKRRHTEKSQAPWGLNLTFEDLLKVRIHLTGAKCDDRRRLSSSQDTKGEIVKEQKLTYSDIKGWYYRDFSKLFPEQIGKQQKEWLFEQNALQDGLDLVFVQPDSCAKADFSQTGQQLSMSLYDKAGRELVIEVTYSKNESGTIRYLERVSEKKIPCFIGKIYLKDGRVRMYPVDAMNPADSARLIEETDSLDIFRQAGGAKPMDSTHPGEETGLSEDSNGQETETGLPGDLSGQEEDGMVFQERDFLKSKYEAVDEIAEEVAKLMEDLYQSGFDTVHESTLEDIQKAAKLSEQFGMSCLSGMLSGLSEEILASRHQMEKKIAPMAEQYASISEYLYICRQKTAYDRGLSYYSDK